MGYKNILVTLDGSFLAEQALPHVIAVAAPGAVLHVLSIVAPEASSLLTSVAISGAYLGPVMDSAELDAINRRDAENDAQLLHSRADYLSQVTAPWVDLGFTVVPDVRIGNVVQTIIETARDGYDVIIMATHGRTGLSKALLGSVTESVLHKAPCPVLVIPTHTTPAVN